MVMYAKIRRMFFREHLTISEIQRRTSLSRNTIKKWLKEPTGAEPKYQRVKARGKLTAYEPMLLMALDADARRPKRDRRTGLMLYKAIQQQGYTGCYSIVTDFIRRWRNATVSVLSKSAFVPLRFKLGEAFQFVMVNINRTLF
jgi:transposase